MINNVAPETLVVLLGASSYSKAYLQHSFNMDQDVQGKAFWVYDSSGTEVKEWLVTTPAEISQTFVTIPGLTPSTSYSFKGQFFDQMIDPELLNAKFGINISDQLSIPTKTYPTLSSITVSATQVEVGVSSPTVNFSCQGDAEFIEVQYKLTTSTEWATCYNGQMLNPASVIVPVGTYHFRVRGNISLPDGKTIEASPWHQYPSTVNVQYMAVPPSKPHTITFQVQKIKDGVERYDVKVGWSWSRSTGQQIKQFILEYTPAQKFNSSGWSGSQKVNTSSSQFQILNNFPFDQSFKLRVTADSWGPNDTTMSTQSDVVTLIIDKDTAITDNFTKETGVEVSYAGIKQFIGSGQSRKQTFNLDQSTGNLAIGILDGQGKAPFTFDAINNILNVSGRTITDTINAASFILTNTSGTSPALYSQEKPQYGNANQGIWMGYGSNGKFLFDLGDAQKHIRWDGNTLRIAGNVTIGTVGGDTSLDDALVGKNMVPIYQQSGSAPSRPTATQYPPPGWYSSPPQFNPTTQKVWVSTGVINPLTNILVSGAAWSSPVQFSGSDGQSGQVGQSSFKSVVFVRNNSTPSTPSGGSYSSSVPSGWSDGVPQGTQKLWSSTRIFTDDGQSPQQPQWTTPQAMTDTSTLQIMYSSTVNNPGDPSSSASNWSSTSSTSTIWMQTRTSSNGVWSSWSVTKVKGETGSTGPTGPTGPQGPQGGNGAPGQRGPGFYAQSLTGPVTQFNTTEASNFFSSNFGTTPQKYDVLTQFTQTNVSQQVTRMWNGSSWVTPSLMVHGDMIATGTVRAEQLVADAAFFQKAGINTIYDRAAQLGSNPEGTYKMKIDLAQGFIHIR